MNINSNEMNKINNSLLSIVRNLNKGQLVYQKVDELITVLDDNNRQSIIEAVCQSTTIEQVMKESVQDCGFDDLCSWAQKEDGLFLVDKELLICLSEEDSKLLA